MSRRSLPLVFGLLVALPGLFAHAQALAATIPDSRIAGSAHSGSMPEVLPPNDPRRAEIFEAVRKPVEARLRRPVTFIVRLLQVQGDFAFAQLRPFTAAGHPIDLSPMSTGWHGDGATLCALLRRDPHGAWHVLALQVGTQVHVWAAQFRAPDSLFPPDD